MFLVSHHRNCLDGSPVLSRSPDPYLFCWFTSFAVVVVFSMGLTMRLECWDCKPYFVPRFKNNGLISGNLGQNERLKAFEDVSSI